MKIIIFAVAFGMLLLLSGGAAYAGDNEDNGADAPWRQRFSINVSGSSGNTRSFDARAAWRARREVAAHRTLIDARYNFGTVGSDVIQSAFTSGARRDWLIPDATWFVFGEGRYDFDDFRSWRHRVSSHWGVGDELRKTETFELLGRAGVGASKQWERTDDLRPEGLLGAEMVWDITETQELFASSYIYPDLLDLSEFRVVSKAEINVEIDHARGMSLIAGVEHDYESSAGPEARNWDFRYYAGLSVGF